VDLLGGLLRMLFEGNTWLWQKPPEVSWRKQSSVQDYSEVINIS
jgi:hypothetical protein